MQLPVTTGCRNPDGSPSEYFVAYGNAVGCGANEGEAILAAGIAYGASFGDEPGQCQFTKGVRTQACACTLPAGVAGARLASPGGTAWSAFAVGPNGRWGQGVHRATFAEAAQLAQADCGEAGCQVWASTTDLCVAVAESRLGGFWIGVGGGNAPADASANALRWCHKTAPAGSCQIARASCRP